MIAVSTAPHTLKFPGRIGLGTWHMGSSARQRSREVSAVSHALAVGYRLLDTAEMYAEGGAELVIGEALKGYGPARRGDLTIVSKVLPGNASRAGTIAACEASIGRMGCEYIDLYLLHWPGRHPFTETLKGFQELLQRKLIRHFGVSNLDGSDLDQWLDAEERIGVRGATVECNQVYYSVESRGIEFNLLPWQRERAIQTMAYSPLGQGALAQHPALMKLGRQRGVSAAQIALAWCIREPDVVAIPKSVDPRRIEDNFNAGQLTLTAAELTQIDRAFPPPRSQQSLEML
jgi:diketogulonate reductase-like aldo/keto reductase